MEVLEILQDDSGRIYAPWLVDAFTRFITVNLETRDALEDREPPPADESAPEAATKVGKGIHLEASSQSPDQPVAPTKI